MKLLVIDTLDLLERYQRSESMFDFYPQGLKGLIAEHFTTYLSVPNLSANQQPEFSFIDKVLDHYHNSQEYRLHALSPDHIDQAPLIFIILLEVDKMVRQVVQIHQQDLQRVVVDIDTMQWGASYVALEMVS